MDPLTGPIRRTTLVTRNREQALAFYQDLLGWEPFYDQPSKPSVGVVLGIPTDQVHVTVLRCQDDQSAGMVGLIQFLNPQVPLDEPIRSGPIRPGEAYLFFSSSRFDELLGRLDAAGCEVIMPIAPAEKRGASPREIGVRDPDGVAVVIIERPA